MSTKLTLFPEEVTFKAIATFLPLRERLVFFQGIVPYHHPERIRVRKQLGRLTVVYDVLMHIQFGTTPAEQYTHSGNILYHAGKAYVAYANLMLAYYTHSIPLTVDIWDNFKALNRSFKQQIMKSIRECVESIWVDEEIVGKMTDIYCSGNHGFNGMAYANEIRELKCSRLDSFKALLDTYQITDGDVLNTIYYELFIRAGLYV
jgi:hypothetical protein